MATPQEDMAPPPASDPPPVAAEKSEAEPEPEKSEEEILIEKLANALEEKIAAHGERGLECAPAYVEYARALLRKAQSESDPFGGALKKEDEPSGGGPSADDSDDADEDDEEGGDEPESDDLELSFQCFEVARLIYEEAGEAHTLSLADVLESLGEVAMENEMWENAISELEASLSLKRKLLPADDRQLATLHYQAATAAVARMEKARHDATNPPTSLPLPGAADEPVPTPEECEKIFAKFQAQAVAGFGWKRLWRHQPGRMCAAACTS